MSMTFVSTTFVSTTCYHVNRNFFEEIGTELKNFNPQKIVFKLSEVTVGSGIRDPDPGSGKNQFRIPDPGVKKAPDPGSGSATLWIRIRIFGVPGPGSAFYLLKQKEVPYCPEKRSCNILFLVKSYIPCI